jgi:hypothetical protein
MNFTILTKNTVKPREFVDFWSSFYNYLFEDSYALIVGKKRFMEADLAKLFEWKNGGKLAQKKKKALESIIDKIDQINALKTKFCIDTFLKEFSFVKGAIWKTFLLHIIQPDSFPIFDQHVYRAYLFIVKNKRGEIPDNKRKQDVYFSEYVPFFNGLAGNGVSRKKLDEALWSFGKFLKTPYGGKI